LIEINKTHQIKLFPAYRRGRSTRKIALVGAVLEVVKAFLPISAFKTTPCCQTAKAILGHTALAMQAAVVTLPATLLRTAMVSSLIINLLRITMQAATLILNLETSRLKEDTTMAVAASREMIVWI
jgi:hypothetical protein